MFKMMKAFFAMLTNVFTAGEKITNVAVAHATIYEEEANFLLGKKRDELDKQMAIALATPATPYVAEA